MISGLGIDLCNTARVARLTERYGMRLYRRLLTTNELSELDKFVNKSAFLARRIAAKEAIAKALGTGIAKGISWQHMAIDHIPSGQPIVQLTGKAEKLLAQRSIQISITDEHDVAAAVAVIVGKIPCNKDD